MQLNFVLIGIMCEIFPRPNPRYMLPEHYHWNKNIVNQMLPVLLEDSLPYTSIFWRHLRLIDSPLPIFDFDGVHLSTIGLKKYYRSLRLAIMHALDAIHYYRYW